MSKSSLLLYFSDVTSMWFECDSTQYNKFLSFSFPTTIHALSPSLIQPIIIQLHYQQNYTKLSVQLPNQGALLRRLIVTPYYIGSGCTIVRAEFIPGKTLLRNTKGRKCDTKAKSGLTTDI